MNYEPFFDEMQQKKPKDTILSALRGRVEALFGGSSNASPDDRDNIAKLFAGARGGLSASLASQTKTYVTELYRWLEQRGEVSQETLEYVESLTVDDVMEFSDLEFSYFGSLDSVLDFIELVCSTGVFLREKEKNNVIAIAILAWYGVDAAEASNLTVEDLSDEYCSVAVANEMLPLSDEHYKLLKLNALGGRVKIAESDRLLVNRKKEDMTPAKIRETLKNFNAHSSQFGKVLRYTDIFRSGLMSRARECTERTGEDPRDAIRTLRPGISKYEVYRTMKLYRRWSETFADEQKGEQKNEQKGG